MLRFIAILLVFGAIVQYSQAQSFFALQAEVAEPTASFRTIAGTGYGARGTYIHFIGSYFALEGSVAFVKWGPRTDFPPNNDFSFVSVPITGGVHLLLTKGLVAPYLGFSLGADYLKVRGIAINSTTYEDKSELRFCLRPQVGVGIHVAGSLGLLLSGSYNVIYTANDPTKYFGLNAGLAVGL